MPKVFISYRQVNDAECERVRDFGERLRASGIEVVLDQFYLDDNPGGPPDKWSKWSSDQALNTERVLIIGSESWFLCFDGKQPPGTGLGAACEADDLRTRIYDAANINEAIRVVLFDDKNAAHISSKLRGWHWLHAERDFKSIVKWISGKSTSVVMLVSTAIPNNLPRLPHFFGREKELGIIADALKHGRRTWGVLIDGPGGMGKTSLAIRAAELVPRGQFQRIMFLSAKEREMTADGEKKLTGFIVPGYLDMLNEIARQLKLEEFAKKPEEERARLLLEAMADQHALLILDNLESLTPEHRDLLFTFLGNLPQGCKAIVTSRRRTDVDARILRLGKLDQQAALDYLTELSEGRTHLQKATDTERRQLYEETGGNPLVIRWLVGQLGKGRCKTVSKALEFLRGAPKDNDPLEFIFRDLLETFTDSEEKVLAALSYFNTPIEIAHLAELGEQSHVAAQTALDDLTDRALVAADVEEKKFLLVPLVSEFLRRALPTIIENTGNRLQKRAYELIVEIGYEKYELFPKLEAAWSTVGPALRLFVTGENDRFQKVSEALDRFLEFTGRWDEWLWLTQQAESRAVGSGDSLHAGWRAYRAGWVYYLRQQPEMVIACADRAAVHWQSEQFGANERATAIHLRGIGYELRGDYSAAIAAYRESSQLLRSVSAESKEVASALNDLADAYRRSGDREAAEKNLAEALIVAHAVGDAEGVAIYQGNLAELALDRQDWFGAETIARETLILSEKVGRQELIAQDCFHLARALVRQGRRNEAYPHALRSVEIYTHLGSPELKNVLLTLKECEAESAK